LRSLGKGDIEKIPPRLAGKGHHGGRSVLDVPTSFFVECELRRDEEWRLIREEIRNSPPRFDTLEEAMHRNRFRP